MVIGFDIGGANCVAAVTRKNTGKVSAGNFIDIVLDEGSKRSVPPVVGFPDKERIFGHPAAKRYKSLAKSTVRRPGRLLGKSAEEAAQEWSELTGLANGYETIGGVVTPVIEVPYKGETVRLAPEHVMALMLKHQYKHCQEGGMDTNECCIAIPNNCNYSKRESLMASAELAGLNALKLVTSTSCLALDYGLLGGKSKGPDMATLFLDCGHNGIDMGVVKFFDGGWDVVAIDTFPHFSGAYLDEVLLGFFDSEFHNKFGDGFMGNRKAVSKVEAILKKVKKNLVANEDARTGIDYLHNDEDFTCEITREQLWGLCADRVGEFCEYLKLFLRSAKERLGDTPFTTVETVGGVCRMVDFRKQLSAVLGEEIGVSTLQQQLNTDEAVARGCVLQTATLSPRFAIQPRKVKDVIPFSILVGRQRSDFPVESWEECSYEPLFKLWSELHKTKSITFKKPRSLRILLVEENTCEVKNLIGWVDINAEGCSLADGENYKKFQVIVDLDHSGLLAFRVELTKSRIDLVDVAKEVEVEKSEEEYQKELEEAQNAAREKAIAARNAKIEAYKKRMEEKVKAEAEKEDGDGDVEMSETAPAKEAASTATEETNPEDEELVIPEVTVSKTKKETKTEKVEKTRLMKESVPCVFTSKMGMTQSTKDSIQALEKEQSVYDQSVFAVQAARNNLEKYTLEAQSDFESGGTYHDFMTGEEKENFMNLIWAEDDFLMDDDFDQTVEVYNERLANLTSVSNIIVQREEQWSKRPAALEMMKKLTGKIEMFIMEGHNAEDYAHIEDIAIEGIKAKVKEASSWLDQAQQAHAQTGKTTNPPFLSSEVSTKMRELNTSYTQVKNIPKPKPEPKEEKAEEAEKKGDEESKTEENKEDVEMEPEKKGDEAKPEAQPAAEDVEMEEATN